MVFLREEDKQLILDRYSDIEWCDDVSDFRCVRCHRVAINHFVSECRHIFCHDCTNLYSKEKPSTCSRCHKDITQPDDQEFDVEVKIHQLKVCCPNKKHGCKYAGQLRKIPSHLMTCVDKRETTLPAQSLDVNQLANLKTTFGEMKLWMRELKDTFEEIFNELQTKTDDMDGEFNALTQNTSMTNKDVDVELVPKKYKKESQLIGLILESVNQIIRQNELLLQHTNEPILLKMEEVMTKMASMIQEIKEVKDKVSKIDAALNAFLIPYINYLQSTAARLTMLHPASETR